jgi:hypothetical protein
MAQDQRHLEVVVELKPGGDAAAVVAWLERQGLATAPLVAGLLASGDRDGVQAAFGSEPRGTLAVPAELAEHVASIAVVPPKEMHGLF